MSRIAVLAVVLTLAGTPAATAACLVWCGSPCSSNTADDSAVLTNQNSCDEQLLTAPGLREDSSERMRASVTHPASPSFRAAAYLEGGGLQLVVSREHAPLDHSKAHTVLRI